MITSSIRSFANRTMLTWVVLAGCTVLSWAESSSGRPATPVVLVVLSLTAIKTVLIIASYMEISHAPRWLQAVCATWVAVVFAMLTYLLCAQPC